MGGKSGALRPFLVSHKRPRTSRILSILSLTATVWLALGTGVSAQTSSYPPENYKPLLFDPAETTHAFRLDGAPWICRGDTFCKPVKIDGVADKNLKQATIEPLGYAGRRYFSPTATPI